jgi:nitrite reductase/ring-hydroxylating ferredoxin subunit
MANQQQAPGTGAFDPAHIARSAWSDQEIFDREMSRIFRRTWVFVAHESEIASPGDYVTRRIGLDPVIVVRLDDGSIGVHLNACAHRGTQLCNATRGNTSHFRCPYHGWTYNTRGQLRGVPMLRKVYGQLDKGYLGQRRGLAGAVPGRRRVVPRCATAGATRRVGDRRAPAALHCARQLEAGRRQLLG